MGKNNFGKNLVGRENKKDANLTKKISWGYTWRKIFTQYYPPYLKKKFQFLPIHTSRKIAYTNMYITQKLINQFLNQVEYSI